ncbi:glycosyltransferase family 4 protein [Neisseria montereyensis]|uniref:Glycosyltransferase family 4 protein n=1 Tax=Neisseria montereyensis TaxID=2973938 RepID=A0ABT2FE89_9NEIS|nr:glycosyltransferase family 4 protein [Neisseria montereyensis]MCS4534529.1 glycosyltransferase family 4 protein [Neisseria montereyensis]
MSKIIINHVMSNDAQSGIFNSIIEYFSKYSPTNFEHIVSISPIENADIYHYHRPHLESKLKPNSVCTVHHDLNDPDPWHAKFRFIPRYMEAAAIVCLNQTQKNILVEQNLAESKLLVIPHGYHSSYLKLKNKSQWLNTPAGESKKITLGIASRRYGRRVKGDAYLLELAKRLDPEYFRFVFVGQDRSLSCLEMRNLGYEAIAYERLPYRMFQSFYEEIDILLMCSSHEGGPANAPEALATGTPIFSSRIGIPKDILEEGINGLFLSLDPDQDAENIMNICVYEPEQLVSLIQNASKPNPKIFTWESCINKNIEVYKSIIN